MPLTIRSRAAIGVSAPRHGKVFVSALGALVLVYLACFVFTGCDFNKRRREALAEGDRLYATDPAGASVKYREGFDAAGPRKAEVLQRIVDAEAKAGNLAEAKKWVQRGLNEKLQVSYETQAARELLAQVERERDEAEAKKQAEKEAKERNGNAVDAYRHVQKVVKAELQPLDVKFGAFPDTKQNADGSWTSIGAATAKGAIGGKEKYLFKVTVRRLADGQWEAVETKVGFDPN